jgi:hypothetical protein
MADIAVLSIFRACSRRFLLRYDRRESLVRSQTRMGVLGAPVGAKGAESGADYAISPKGRTTFDPDSAPN